MNGTSEMNRASRSQSTETGQSGTATTAANRAARLGELTSAHLAILAARGIDAETLARLGVESLAARGGGSDAIAIPFRLNGVTVNHKYRTISGEKRFHQDAGAPKIFWNHDAITDPSLASQQLIVTEGEFDAMIAMQAGYQRVVSVPDGAPSQPLGEAPGGSKYGYVADALPHLRDAKEIVLAVDADGPGRNLMQDLSIRFGSARCKWVEYPEGCKDLNDVWLKHGQSAVVACIQNARWLRVEGLFRMSELPPVNEPAPAHNSLGLYAMRRADFCVVTGIPGHGKSTFVNDLCCRMVEEHGWDTTFASFEQSPQIDHRRALRSWHSGKLECHMADWQKAEADAWIDKHFSFVVPPDDAECDLLWLLDKLAASVIRHNTSIVVIDPWNEMDHRRDPAMTTTEYVGFAIRELKRFAKRLNVHLIVVAHPIKLRRDPKTGEFPKPALYDISDSAHWANKPEVGLIVHRGEAHGETTVALVKSRYHDKIGEPQERKYEFHRPSSRYKSGAPA